MTEVVNKTMSTIDATRPANTAGNPDRPEEPGRGMNPSGDRPSSSDSVKKSPKRSLFDPEIARPALREALIKLDPRHMWRNPVMFIVEIGAVITTIILIGGGGDDPLWFVAWISAWLWFTVLFANFAEAMAEGRGKAQADTLRKTRTETMAKVLVGGDRSRTESRASADLRPGDLVLVEAGDTIPSDGEVIEGVAYVSEAAITGESAPVLKEPGTDISSSVTGGTQVVSDQLVVKITAEPGKTFLDRMIALVEGASRQKTPNEIALNILLAGLTIIFLIVVVTLRPISEYAGSTTSITVLIALLVTLIPTTIGGLLSAIGIAGMDRLVQRNVLAMSGRAVEAAGDVDVLLLDKTGTITYGSRQAAEFIPVHGVSPERLTAAALRSSLADGTPEGKSIVTLAERLGQRPIRAALDGAEFVPFTAETRMSGLTSNGHTTMKGAVDAVIRVATVPVPSDLHDASNRVASAGGTPLAVVEDGEPLGIIYLKDTVKPGMRERFADLRAMGIRTVMITGDNRLTAQTIADRSRGRRLRRRGQTGRQDPDHPRAAGRWAAGGDDRRRHQRRPGPGPVRCRRGDEHRHGGRERGRQHGRPRLRPDQADRDRRDRQATAHDPRRPDHLQHRQRRRQVFRDHPGAVRRGV